MAEEGYRSHTVTNIANNRQISIGALNKQTPGNPGHGNLLTAMAITKGKAFRIAHMGEVRVGIWIGSLCHG